MLFMLGGGPTAAEGASLLLPLESVFPRRIPPSVSPAHTPLPRSCRIVVFRAKVSIIQMKNDLF